MITIRRQEINKTFPFRKREDHEKYSAEVSAAISKRLSYSAKRRSK